MIASRNFINCTNEIDEQEYRYFNQPMKCKEFNIINSVLCSYQLIIELINDHKKTTLSLKNIITELIKKYTQLFENDNYKQRILSVWNNEGKEDLSYKLANKIVTIDDIITEDTYFITTIDIMLLAQIYKIPIVLFSDEPFSELNIKIERLNIYFLINKESNLNLLTVNPSTSASKKYYYIYVSQSTDSTDSTDYKLFYTLDEFKLPETLVISEFITQINTSKSYVNKLLV